LWNEEAKAKGDIPAITTSIRGVTGIRLEEPDDSCDRVPAGEVTQDLCRDKQRREGGQIASVTVKRGYVGEPLNKSDKKRELGDWLSSCQVRRG
jgi:hypothetical protein